MRMTYPALEHEALDFFDYLTNFSKSKTKLEKVK